MATLVKVAPDETTSFTVELGNVKAAFQSMSLLVSWQLLSTELNGVWEDHGCSERRLMKEDSSKVQDFLHKFLITDHLSLYASQVACADGCRRRYEAAKKGSASVWCLDLYIRTGA